MYSPSSWPRSSPGPRSAELRTGGKRRWSGSRVIQRSRRDDEERCPRDVWRATSREKAKPTIGSSSGKLFFGPVMRECTLLDGGVGQIEHLRSRFGTSEPVALSTDARSSFLSTATLDPRGADPLCSIAEIEQLYTSGTSLHLGNIIPRHNPRGESQFTHFTSIIFPDVWQTGTVLVARCPYYVFALLGQGGNC